MTVAEVVGLSGWCTTEPEVRNELTHVDIFSAEVDQHEAASNIFADAFVKVRGPVLLSR